MATDAKSSPTQNTGSGQPDKPIFHDSAEETADRAILGGAPVDHRLGDEVAARTETPREAAIDAANGLRSHGGRVPVPADFEGLLTPAGNSGNIVGSDVDEERVFTLGEDGATVSPPGTSI